MHTVGPGIWRETWKSRKMRNTHFRMWNMARKTEKAGKFRNVNCSTWNMAIKLKIMENEKHSLDDLKNEEITENREKREMHTIDLEYGEKPENHVKWEIHALGREISGQTLKKVENLEMSTVGHGIWQENWKSWKMRNIHLTTWKMTKPLKNVKNEKCTLLYLEYGEITENHGKWEIHTLGSEIWRGKLKKVENLEMSTVGHGIWQDTENYGKW
jgi:hypothetical protein